MDEDDIDVDRLILARIPSTLDDNDDVAVGGILTSFVSLIGLVLLLDLTKRVTTHTRYVFYVVKRSKMVKCDPALHNRMKLVF